MNTHAFARGIADTSIAVAVVGSANLDIVVATEHIPLAGETVLGSNVSEFPGGKGVNQAIAAARGVPTAFIGAVGSDNSAAVLKAALVGAGVNIAHLKELGGASGTAFISVSADGENSIVVVPGSNWEIEPDDVTHALEQLAPEVVVTQLETSVDTVLAAVEWARAAGKRWVFNPSPLDQWLRLAEGHPLRAALSAADPLIVNSGEARGLLHESGTGPAELLARRLGRIARSVIVTDGSKGAHVVSADGYDFVDARRVAAVDTTGAGDCFAGTVASGLSAGRGLVQAAQTATVAAADTVRTRREDR